MVNGVLYWLTEYAKVLFGYGFLLFVWPLTIFRQYLKNKSVTFKFSFCVTAQVVIVNTVVLLMGLLHILNDWTLRIIFYGSFLYSIRHCFALTKERKTKFKYLVHGSFGIKNFLLLERRKYFRKLENVAERFWGFYKKHWLEYSLLIVTVVYGVVYFSWGVFHNRVYGFSDMNVHHSWIYQLSEGTSFSAGIYPEGMHCLVYAINALFGVRLYSCMLFLASVNSITVFIAIYCFGKELFQWRFSAVLSLLFFLIFGSIGRHVMISMARFQCALPQEIAFPAVILCGMYLLKYLKGGKLGKWRGKKTKGFWDENLLLFTLALAVTIAVHFYATMMAFFLCLGIALLLWKRIFTKERFVPLVCSVMAGLFIAVVPMAAGVISGIPLQGSLYWALSIIQGEEESGTSLEQGELEVSDAPETVIMESDVLPSEREVNAEKTGQQMAQSEQSAVEKYIGKIQDICSTLWSKVLEISHIVYKKGLIEPFSESFAKYLSLVLGAVIFGGILRKIMIMLMEKVQKKEIYQLELSGYYILLMMLAAWLVFYIPNDLGLPSLIEQYRIGFIYTMLASMILLIPLDYVFILLSRVVHITWIKFFSLLAAVGLLALIQIKGWYHSYLYYELIRYDSVVQVANQIIDSLPENTYTIISPTEEIYQVIEYGRHEELIDFIENQNKENYTLPTNYVFIVVEKQPLRHAQYHFHNGPKWLAENTYRNIFGLHSVYPEYLHYEISEEAAQKEMYRIGNGYDSYKDGTMRTIIESKAYEWCKNFSDKYPNEVKTFYEDEYIVCYYWKQNPYNLYNLSINE